MLRDSVLDLLKRHSDLTDREITEIVLGRGKPQQSVNQLCRKLEAAGLVQRVRRIDGFIGNRLVSSDLTLAQPTKVGASAVHAPLVPDSEIQTDERFSEDNLKRQLVQWLEADGWAVQVAWGKTRGIDIDARKGPDRWVIEVKGSGSRQAMRVNYFISMLGETLQRMSDANARYSIALPDMKQFRGLWNRLPTIAKQRTKISMLFVSQDKIEHLES